MMLQKSLLFSLLFFLFLPCPAQLYTLHNCQIDVDDPYNIYCDELSRIPSDIPNSTVSLVISDGNIKNIQKSDFRGLSGLQRFFLEKNQISHIEDAAFSYLSNLTVLELSQNRLKVLTDRMFEGLSNLTMLDLEENQIEFISELTFAPLRNLQSLCLSGNRLSHISVIVNVFSSCPGLQTLDLSFNYFTLFESETFPFLLNVSELDLSGNPLQGFMLHSDLFPRLKRIDLSDINYQFQWAVSDKAFLKNLKTLHLSRTNLTKETYQSVFRSADSVENLRLTGVRRPLDKELLNLVCGIPSLQTLELFWNAVPIINNSLLQSCSNITYLDLSHSSISSLTGSSLRMLTRLSKLYLTSNRLDRVPLTIRNMSTLTSLSFFSNHISKLHCLDFEHLWQLTELNLESNNLATLKSCVFRDLHSLKILHLEDNFILQFDNSFGASLPNLFGLYANGNNMAWIQRGVFKNMSHLRELKFTSLKGTNVEEGAWEGLQDLKELSYTPSLFRSETGVGSNMTSWRHYHLKQKELLSLQSLDISISVDVCVLFAEELLQGLNNLKTFTSFHLFCKPPHKDMFNHTPLLQNLQIFHNDNLNLEPEVFHPITHLQVLELPLNHLKSLDFLFEANLTKLQKLFLRDNDLIVIKESVFEALPSLKYIDLSGNPFVCNCSNAGFIHWVLTNKQVYVDDAFRYRCAHPPSYEGHLLLDFDVQLCWDFPGKLCFIFSSTLILITLFSKFTYHFLRWQLLYSFYLAKAFVYDSKNRRQGCPEVYDAFVSYNVHDEDWVYEELVPELEERQGWKLCLHHRDFEPGKAILENITDAIYSSRKTLCVISRHYLQSEWCSHEIQMASFRLLDEQKDVLILLFLEEISSLELNPFYRVRKLLKSRTYLSWTGGRSHRGLFWERVRRALQCGAQISADNPLADDV